MEVEPNAGFERNNNVPGGSREEKLISPDQGQAERPLSTQMIADPTSPEPKERCSPSETIQIAGLSLASDIHGQATFTTALSPDTLGQEVGAGESAVESSIEEVQDLANVVASGSTAGAVLDGGGNIEGVSGLSNELRPPSIMSEAADDDCHADDEEDPEAYADSVILAENDSSIGAATGTDAPLGVSALSQRGSAQPRVEANTKFQHIMRELISTEQVYLRDLTDIVVGYQKKLMDALDAEDIEMIFGNLEDLLDFHTELFSGMEQLSEIDPYLIGEVFLRMGIKRFMVYEKYYLNHMKSLSYLFQRQEDSEFLSQLVECQTALGHQLPLADYLLKPVQRLLKYPLLFVEMIKSTGGEVTGFESLHEASNLLKEVADNINEIKRRLDVSKYVESLQKRLLSWDGPDLVTFGQLKDAGFFKVSDASNKKSQRQILLFELGILICKPRAGGFVSVKHYFKMDDLYLQTMLNEALCFRLTLAHNKKVYFTFYCKNQDEKQYWIAKIKKVIIDFHTQGKKPQPPPPAVKPKSARRPVSDRSKSLKDRDTDLTSPQASRRKFEFLQRRATARKRFSASEPSEDVSLSHAPVSKAVPDDQRLMHNPFAQAGGFEDGDAPEKKISHEVDISKRGGGIRRSGKHRSYTRSHTSPVQSLSPPPFTGGSSRGSSLKRASIFSSMSESSNPENPSLHDMDENESVPDHDEAALEAASVAAKAAIDAPTIVVDGEGENADDSITEDVPGAHVVRCNLPDSTHTSVSIKPGGTMKEAFEAKLKRRGLRLGECIVQVPADPTLKIPWSADAMEALHGHNVINVSKVKGSMAKLRSNSKLVIRVPSGNIIISGQAGDGVISTPDKPSLAASRLEVLPSAEPMIITTDEDGTGNMQISGSVTGSASVSTATATKNCENAGENTASDEVATSKPNRSSECNIYAPAHGPKPKLPARFARRLKNKGKPPTSDDSVALLTDGTGSNSNKEASSVRLSPRRETPSVRSNQRDPKAKQAKGSLKKPEGTVSSSTKKSQLNSGSTKKVRITGAKSVSLRRPAVDSAETNSPILRRKSMPLRSTPKDKAVNQCTDTSRGGSRTTRVTRTRSASQHAVRKGATSESRSVRGVSPKNQRGSLKDYPSQPQESTEKADSSKAPIQRSSSKHKIPLGTPEMTRRLKSVRMHYQNHDAKTPRHTDV